MLIVKVGIDSARGSQISKTSDLYTVPDSFHKGIAQLLCVTSIPNHNYIKLYFVEIKDHNIHWIEIFFSRALPPRFWKNRSTPVFSKIGAPINFGSGLLTIAVPLPARNSPESSG
ncbi:uncharacterized protein VTP21DRAFT_1608 [Calcarisporiella thermophila]|uniref:uncharacterized protein n=1 Tax=Calcarisporiella thermophila TaxID=911321 RepID=UPI0037432C9F